MRSWVVAWEAWTMSSDNAVTTVHPQESLNLFSLLEWNGSKKDDITQILRRISYRDMRHSMWCFPLIWLLTLGICFIQMCVDSLSTLVDTAGAGAEEKPRILTDQFWCPKTMRDCLRRYRKAISPLSFPHPSCHFHPLGYSQYARWGAQRDGCG